VFVPASIDPPAEHDLHYEPFLLALGTYRIDDRRWTETPSREIAVAAPLTTEAIPVAWESARALAIETSELAGSPTGRATFGALPPAAVEKKSYTTWKLEFVEWVTRTQSLTIWKSPSLGEVSRPAEDECAFRIRLQQHARERRDAGREKLEEKYGARAARLEERIRKAEQTVAREEEQARQAKLQTAVSIGATVLGTLFGRRGLGRATTAARGVGRSLDQAGDVGRAEENVSKLREELAALDAELRAEIEDLGDRIDPLTEALETITVRPEKNDVSTRLVALGWLPWWAGPGGVRAPARGDLV
jgi:hypothetical protein